MDHFNYQSDQGHCENVALQRLADAYGTPLYVYSGAQLDEHCRELKAAFAGYPTLLCYAVKANGNLSLLKRIFAHGFGADVVSVGELERAVVAGVDPHQIVFSGVGKQEAEIQRALEVGILSFNVESKEELHLIHRVATYLGRRARISLRVNPNIDVKTHPHIATGLYKTKFGMTEAEVATLPALIARLPSLELVGLDCHIGSQITEIAPFREAAARMAELARTLMHAGFRLQHLDLGGGLGIRYQDETAPSFDAFARALIQEVRDTRLKLILEPGRCLVGNAGVLLTRVLAVKENIERRFVIVDAAMNDLLRPSLYDAYHEILPVSQAPTEAYTWTADIVGPVCETGDYLGLERKLPPVASGDLLMVRGAGAYGMSMASNYNVRARPAEVLVTPEGYQVVRPRETLESLWASELPPLKK